MAAIRLGWERGETERCSKLVSRLRQGSDCLASERQGEGFLVPEVSLGPFRMQPEVTRGLGDLGSWSEPRERASYLARVAGEVEGVDVLGAEAHHPAVDAIKIGAPGGVAGIAEQLCSLAEGLCLVAGDLRPQEPGQRAEQRQRRAAEHGGRRALGAPKHKQPEEGASKEMVLPKPPVELGAGFSSWVVCGRTPAAGWSGADQILMCHLGSPKEVTRMD